MVNLGVWTYDVVGRDYYLTLDSVSFRCMSGTSTPSVSTGETCYYEAAEVVMQFARHTDDDDKEGLGNNFAGPSPRGENDT